VCVMMTLCWSLSVRLVDQYKERQTLHIALKMDKVVALLLWFRTVLGIRGYLSAGVDC
jgi:hypothetical protein